MTAGATTRPGAWAAPGAPSGAGAGSGPLPALTPAADPWSAGLPRAEAGVAVARADARAPVGPGTERIDGDGPLAEVSPTGPGGVLDGGFDLLRFRFGRLVGLTALVFLPLQVVELVLSLTIAHGVASVESGDAVGGIGMLGSTGTSGGWQLVFVAVRAVALCLLGIGVGFLVASWWDGEDPSLGRTVRFMARRCWVAPLLTLFTGAVKVPLLCLGGVGYFLGDALFFIAGVVAGAEQLGPAATVRRSVLLTRPAYGLSIVVCFGGFVIGQVLQLALTAGPVALLASFEPPEEWLVVVQQATSLVLLVVLPLTACIAARAYVELRCRVEGVDLARRQVLRGLG